MFSDQSLLELVRVLVPQFLVMMLLVVYVFSGSVIFVLLDDKIANETFTEVVLFSFTTLTTIGYGNISPSTNSAQLFCIVFSIVGIPLALLTLANLGKYLTKIYWLMLVCFGKNIKWRACQNANMPLPTTTSLLLITFAFGSFFFYEKGRGFTVDDIYFSVISFSTVGFGDRKPSANDSTMLIGMVLYLIWGIILMTTLFAGVSGYLRTIHHLGKRLRGSRDVQVWFGGRSMKVSKLLQIVAKEFNASPRQIKGLLRDLDDLIKTAIEENQQISAKPSILQIASQYKYKGSRKLLSLQEFPRLVSRRKKLHKFSMVEDVRVLKAFKDESITKAPRKDLIALGKRSNSVDIGEISRYKCNRNEF
ncbi:unnamed protein product [Enterobius vermicularis]|uniref:Ion_trans_2 domain-containing protein n=1 Tax=Enterobius vermicularis TaxID=51028 RepID=A0A158QA33_ENTVE|nr:unnamed protein product [Enterobius vermicularis]